MAVTKVIDGEDRRHGIPLTDEERAQRHYEQYGTSSLPPRGSGLGQASGGESQPFWRRNNPMAWAAGIAGVLILSPLLKPKRSRANPRRGRRREKLIHVPRYTSLVAAGTEKPISAKQARRFGVPAMAMNPRQSVFLITPLTKKAKAWVKKNVYLASWQWMGAGFAVEHRFADHLVAGMMESGLIQHKDFTVS